MLTVRDAASQFLAKRRIAVTGVSRSQQGHGSNVVYRRLRERGYEVFAVNPNADKVEGDRSFHDLKSIPGGVEAVVIATRPDRAEFRVSSAASFRLTAPSSLRTAATSAARPFAPASVKSERAIAATMKQPATSGRTGIRRVRSSGSST